MRHLCCCHWYPAYWHSMDIRKLVPIIQDKEDIVGVYHQYWLSFFWQWLFGMLVFLSPFFFLPLFLRWGIWGSLLLMSLFALGAWYVIRTYRMWYHSMLILTTERLLIVSQLGFFDKLVSQVELDKLNDISYRKKGLMRTLCNVGSIVIQASGVDKLEINNLRRPSEVQQHIFDEREACAEREFTEYSESDLLAVIKEIRSRVGEQRWLRIVKGGWELKQELIDEVGESDLDKAEAIEAFFSREP